jgi:hypothetical protein
MNYPSDEQKQAFLQDLNALVEKHGIGLYIGGYECEVDLVPAAGSSLEDVAEQACNSDRQFATGNGWDDVLQYGPPVPREIRARTLGGALMLAFEDAIRRDLARPLFAESAGDGVVVAKTVRRIKMSNEMLKDRSSNAED